MKNKTEGFIEKNSKLFHDFFQSEKAGGVLLMVCTVASLILANSLIQEQYLSFWDYKIAGHGISEYVNDGLMAVFFLLIGLELEREVYVGELSNVRNALLPCFAALGGMIFPAGIYFALNAGTPTQAGAGIPMATDIAFALAVLSLIGTRVPVSLKIFLTALAVIDDLGAIFVIAVFYTGSLSWLYLVGSLAVFGILLIFNRLKVHHFAPYLIGGVLMWYLMLHSGIHATVSGVLLAFAIPFGNGDEKSISYRLQSFLHWPVAFLILPLFALANTAVVIPDGWVGDMLQRGSLGIVLGLIIGKPVGIFMFAYCSAALGLTSLPADLKWPHVFGAGLLGAIGFTMSIFITLLAFEDTAHIDQSKIAILIASLISGIIGFIYLKFSLGEKAKKADDHF